MSFFFGSKKQKPLEPVSSSAASPGAPLELVRYSTATGKFEVPNEALEVLRSINGPVGVVSVCGRARQVSQDGASKIESSRQAPLETVISCLNAFQVISGTFFILIVHTRLSAPAQLLPLCLPSLQYGSVGFNWVYLTVQGKSFILNQLLGQSTGFTVGPTHRPCTKGLWMWSTPVEQRAPAFTTHGWNFCLCCECCL